MYLTDFYTAFVQVLFDLLLGLAPSTSYCWQVPQGTLLTMVVPESMCGARFSETSLVHIARCWVKPDKGRLAASVHVPGRSRGPVFLSKWENNILLLNCTVILGVG